MLFCGGLGCGTSCTQDYRRLKQCGNSNARVLYAEMTWEAMKSCILILPMLRAKLRDHCCEALSRRHVGPPSHLAANFATPNRSVPAGLRCVRGCHIRFARYRQLEPRSLPVLRANSIQRSEAAASAAAHAWGDK